MYIQTRMVKMIGFAILAGLTMPLWAQAPVYEAEAMPPEQEITTDQTPDFLPPPPSPSASSAPVNQESEVFVPMQVPAQPSIAAATSGSLENRLRRIEQQMGSMENGGASARVESLQDQVQMLRNQVELLSHQLEQIQNQQKAQFADLDKRLNQTINTSKTLGIEQALPNPVIIKTHKKFDKFGKHSEIISSDNLADLNAKSMDTQPDLAEEQHIYQTAYNLIKAKKYEEAVKALEGMLKRYPTGQFASNAHYWLGELYGLMNKNEQALREFNTVVQRYPESPRVSDAQLKVGLILASEFRWADAKSAFRKVVHRYPGSASARLATEQLKQIRQAGH